MQYPGLTVIGYCIDFQATSQEGFKDCLLALEGSAIGVSERIWICHLRMQARFSGVLRGYELSGMSVCHDPQVSESHAIRGFAASEWSDAVASPDYRADSWMCEFQAQVHVSTR